MVTPWALERLIHLLRQTGGALRPAFTMPSMTYHGISADNSRQKATAHILLKILSRCYLAEKLASGFWHRDCLVFLQWQSGGRKSTKDTDSLPNTLQADPLIAV